MTLDVTAVEALAAEAAHTFSEGLVVLAQKSANEAKLERLRLAEEARRLEELRLSLEEERRCLDCGFARLRLSEERGALEVSDSLPGSLSPIRRQTQCEPGSPLDIEADAGAGRGLYFPLASPVAPAAASAAIEDCQGTLTRCSDEALVSVLCGRCSSWEIAGNGGRVLVDFRPSALVPFLERLANDERLMNGLPMVGESGQCAKRLLELLDRFGLQGWLYQDIAQNLKVESLLAYRGRRYAVLPAAEPDEAAVLLDMYDMGVTVPPGWEVLTSEHQGFSEIIGELSKHGWGTSLLCVKNAGGSFSSYRTVLYTHGGPAGTRVSSDSRVLQAIDEGGRCEKFQFSKGMVLSGRLVICAISSADHSATVRERYAPAP